MFRANKVNDAMIIFRGFEESRGMDPRPSAAILGTFKDGVVIMIGNKIRSLH